MTNSTGTTTADPESANALISPQRRNFIFVGVLLGTVFLCAVPVAVLGFVVALFLEEVPLQEIDAAAATDLGEDFGMPSTDSPEKILEVAVGRMFRDSPEIQLRSLAGGRGSSSRSRSCGHYCRSTARIRCSGRPR